VIPVLFSDAILAGRPIRLSNAGQHSRDFTFVDDIVEGMIRASDRIALPDPDWGPSTPLADGVRRFAGCYVAYVADHGIGRPK
jgi:nucleoside-diphosphate-sugar epimerase